MPGHLLPLTELVSAIKTRLDSVLGAEKAFSLVPQGQAKPYVEISTITWFDRPYKQGFRKEFVTEFRVYDDDQNMQNCNLMTQLALEALTDGTVSFAETSQFRLIDQPVPDGTGDVAKESDDQGIYWRATFRLRWSVQDVISAR
jgi:hypothetical protein